MGKKFSHGLDRQTAFWLMASEVEFSVEGGIFMENKAPFKMTTGAIALFGTAAA